MTPLTHERRFRTRDGAEAVAYESGPSGETTLLFVHGWLADAAIWAPVARLLAEEFRVVRVDLRGSGAASAAPGPADLAHHAADIVDTIDALALDAALVVGHSMGAAIAQRLAVDEPAAVFGLALVNPTPASGVPFPPHVRAMFAALPGDPQRLGAWLARLPAVPFDEPTLVARVAAALRVRPEIAAEQFAAWADAEFAADAATIEQPTLVLAGDRDLALPPALVAREVAAPLADARLEIVAGAGHYLPLERPRLVAERLRAFVDAI